MKKGNIIKGLILGLTLCSSAFLVNSESLSTPTEHHFVYADSHEVAITDAKLKLALCRILDKDINAKLYSDDLIKSPVFIVDPLTPSIAKKHLNLSNSGIKDIKELLQFELPESVVAIDLSGNNLTNEDVKKIDDLLKLTKADIEYTYDKDPDNEIIEEDLVKIPIRSDWDTKILKVNLNNNKINLDDLTPDELNNPKFIYGIQNINLHSSGMNLYDEIKNIKYYFKSNATSNDHVYLSTKCELNQTTYPSFFVDNVITPLIKDNTLANLGEYKITIGNPPGTQSGYFYGTPDYVAEFKVFTAEIPTYEVERKAMFNLQPNDIVINGLNGTVEKDIKNASTNTIGMQDVNIVITNIDTSRNVTLNFKVKDTTSPVIRLKPNNTNVIYWRQNKEFVDPGYLGEDTGDNITHLVQVDYSELDITKLGTYSIKYNLTDLAGNTAQEIIRTVVVQEQVLDEIILRTTTQDLVVGQDIVLVVEPSANIDISKYFDFEYTWYLNGKAFKSTQGDNVTGKSTTTITLDNTSIVDITVELHAKQKIDNADIYVSSQNLELKPDYADNNTTIIAAMIVAVVIVIGVFIGGTISKHRKAKKTNKKSASNSSNKQKIDIQVIKDYPTNGSQNNNPNDKQDK